MHSNLLHPSDEEVAQKMLDILRHSFHVEYYLHALNVESPDDNERPHDIVGQYSKFDMPVLERLALEYRVHTQKVNAFFLEGVNLHRQQYHHRMWNSDDAPVGAMQLAAVDSICSKIEPRIKIEGGSHGGTPYSLDDDKIYRDLRGTPVQIAYMIWALDKMRKVPSRDLQSIASLSSFPNIGLPTNFYKRICIRVAETIDVAEKHGYQVAVPIMSQVA